MTRLRWNEAQHTILHVLTGLLNNAGWHVNHKRVERIWRREGLKVPQKQPKRGRLWMNDGSCVRLRPEHPNHVWSYDFVQDRTHDGRVLSERLNIIDEFTREALMIRVERKLNSTDVVDALTDLFSLRGPPKFIRSDNGPEFIAQKVRDWIEAVGSKTAYIEPGSPLSAAIRLPAGQRIGERLLRSFDKLRMRASMPAFAMNCSTEKSSTRRSRLDGMAKHERAASVGQAAESRLMPCIGRSSLQVFR